MPFFLRRHYMINWIKKHLIKLLTRKVFVVSNKATSEYFIKSHITDDGYISLLTASGSYLPVSYSVFKRMFQPQKQVVDSIYDVQDVVGVVDNKILLASGESVFLADINESCIEDSLDSSW